MNRTRAMFATFVDLDPVPGEFHTTESARRHLNHILKQAIPHYSPVVSDISSGRNLHTIEFDHNNRYWSSPMEYNYIFVRTVLNHLNDKLAARGYLFLNEIYEEFHLPRTMEGQIVGWVDGPISWDWDDLMRSIENNRPIKIMFYTEGSIIDKAFDESKTFEFTPKKVEEDEE